MPDLDLPRGVELWRTTHSTSTTGPFGDAARREIDLVGRLRARRHARPGEKRAGDVDRGAGAFGADGQHPRARACRGFRSPTSIVGDVQPLIVALMIAVGLVLLIASANVANLILLRGESRRQELAVRAALGASRGRIAAQLLAESVVLTLIAGVVGVAFAWWTLRALVANLPEGLPRRRFHQHRRRRRGHGHRRHRSRRRGRGLVPAWLLARGDVAAPLRSGGRGSLGGPGRRTRRALVVLQVSLAVAIVAAAGLLVRTLVHLQSIETGYASDALMFMELSLPQDKYGPRARHEQFLQQATAELATVPGITAATPVNIAPFSGGWDAPRFIADGQSAERAAGNPALNLESIFPNYFATLQIEMVRGRAFVDGDRAGAQLVAIVSEDVAARIWPGEDAVGKRLNIGGPALARPVAHGGGRGAIDALSVARHAATDDLSASRAVPGDRGDARPAYDRAARAGGGGSPRQARGHRSRRARRAYHPLRAPARSTAGASTIPGIALERLRSHRVRPRCGRSICRHRRVGPSAQPRARAARRHRRERRRSAPARARRSDPPCRHRRDRRSSLRGNRRTMGEWAVVGSQPAGRADARRRRGAADRSRTRRCLRPDAPRGSGRRRGVACGGEDQGAHLWRHGI